MYENEVIDMETLKGKTRELNETIQQLQKELLFIRQNTRPDDLFSSLLNNTFQDLEGILSTENITHDLLSRMIQEMEVDQSGHIHVYFNLLSEALPAGSVPRTDNRT